MTLPSPAPVSLWRIATLAFAIRLAAVVFLHDWRAPEAWEYGIIADNLLAGKGYSGSAWFVPEGPTAFMAPGYVFLLYGFRVLFGAAGFALLQCMQAAVGAMSVWLLYRTASAGFGTRIALVAAAVLALHPVHIYLTAVMHPATIIVFCFLAIVFTLLRYAAAPAPGRAVQLGVACGLGALVDPSVTCLAPIIAAAPFLSRAASWRRVAGTGLIGAACAIAVVAPWSVRNYVVFDAFVPIKSPLGYLLWVGNHPETTGTLLYIDENGEQAHINDHVDDALRAELRALGEPGAYQRLGAIASEYMVNAPGETLRRTMGKAVYYWVYPYWLTDPADRARPWLAHVRRPDEVIWMVLVGCAAAGAWLERARLKDWRVYAIFLVPMLCYTALYAVTNLGAGPRYRLPVEVCVSVFAAAALARAVPPSWWRRFGLAMALVAATIPAHAKDPAAPLETPARWLRDRVVVDIRIDGRGPFPFVLDSATPMLIVNERQAESMGVRLYRDSHVEMPAADGALTTAFLGRFNSAYAGGIRLDADEAAVVNLAPFEAWLGDSVAGIVGLHQFNRAVSIDMNAGQLYARAQVPPDGDAIALSNNTAGFPGFNVVLNSTIPAPCMLDLGYGGLFALPESVAREKGLLGDGATILRVRDDGIASSAQTRLHSVLAGYTSMADPIIDLWPAGDRARLGCGVLKTQIITVDATLGRMWLTPHDSTVLTVPARTVTGVGLLPGTRMSGYWSVRVIAQSPADLGGVQTGDILHAVDGISMADATYAAVAAGLAAEPGQRRSYELIRDGAPVTIALTGKPLL